MPSSLKPLEQITEGQYESFINEYERLKDEYEGKAQRAVYRRFRVQAAVEADWFESTDSLNIKIEQTPIQEILRLNEMILTYQAKVDSADADFLSILLGQLKAQGLLPESSETPDTVSNGAPSPAPAG